MGDLRPRIYDILETRRELYSDWMIPTRASFSQASRQLLVRDYQKQILPLPDTNPQLLPIRVSPQH